MSEWGTTDRLRVVARMADGEEITGDIFLQPRVSHHSGPETPLDLLERAEAFFPMAMDDGSVRFLNRAQVAILTCQPIPPEAEIDRLGINRFVPMEFSLVDGSVWTGAAGVNLPPTRHRALDCLNAGSQYLVLWTDEAARYVNRAHMRVVRPLE